MRVLIAALVLSFTALAQVPHVSAYPITLSSGDGTVQFHGTIMFIGASAPILFGSLTVEGDTIPVPPQFVQSLAYGLWWKWTLPGGMRLTVGTYPGDFDPEGLLVIPGTGGSGETYIPLHGGL